jgi:hypothetical protein
LPEQFSSPERLRLLNPDQGNIFRLLKDAGQAAAFQARLPGFDRVDQPFLDPAEIVCRTSSTQGIPCRLA